METALIIASSENSFVSVTELFRSFSGGVASHYHGLAAGSAYVYAHSGSEGRRIILERDFDIVIIISPLTDESGENLARQIAVSGVCQVILAVNSELYGEVSAVCEKDGVLTIAKPIDQDIFRQVLSLAKTMQVKLGKIQSENDSLKQKIDNIRIIDRAKNILISSCRMSEHEAHRHIEKVAMDTRSSKRSVSERIIHDYENGPE